MRLTIPCTGAMMALTLLLGTAAGQQQVPQKKPVPSMTDADVPRNGAEMLVTADKPDASWGRSLSAWDQLKSFRARVTMDLGGGRRIDQKVEVVQPDRVRMTIGPSEIIRVGPRGYARIASGPWQEYPYEDVGGVESLKNLTGNLNGAQNPRLIGTDEVDGAPANIYEFQSVLPVPNGAAVPVTSRVWIGASDGLPRKIESKAAEDGMAVLIVFYDFNAKISIVAPK